MIVNGINIEPSICVNDYHWIKRSWKERLFSLPWKPFDKTKRIHSPTALQIGDVCLVSPQTYAQILYNKIIENLTST